MITIKKIKVLSTINIVLATLASVTGILYPNIYFDTEAVKAVWFANDLVTFILVIPLILYILIKSNSKLTVRLNLLWMSCMWYMIYNYMYYLYGAEFNYLFLVYVGIFISAAYSLIMLLIQGFNQLSLNNFSKKIPVDKISIFLFVFALAIGTPWIILSVRFIFTGELPMPGAGIVFAIDLIFLVSVLVVSSFLLRKRHLLGFLFSTMVMIKGCLYSLVLLIGGITAYIKVGKWDAFVPLYVLLGIGCFISIRIIFDNIVER